MSRREYHRIYADDDGNLVVKGAPVFGVDTIDEPGALDGDLQEHTAMSEYDELGGMDYPSLGDEDDEAGGMDYLSLGARGRHYKTRGHASRRRPASAMRRAPQVVQKTILNGQSGNVFNGRGTITIRPQFDFVAEDLTFQGTTNGVAVVGAGAWTIISISFGDRIIFSNVTGVPIAIFAAASFVRGLIKGASIAAGLDIVIAGNHAFAGTTTAGNLIATLTGLKRGTSGCGPGAV